MPKHTGKATEGRDDQAMRKGEVDRSNDIGLTQAFAPIGDDGWSEGGRHAYSGEEGEIAFEEDSFADDKPGRRTALPRLRATTPTQPMRGTRRTGSSDAGAPLDADDAYTAGEARGSSQGAHAGGFSYKGDDEDEYPDALESLEPVVEPSTFDPDVPADPAPARGATLRLQRRKSPPTCANRAACVASSLWSWCCSCFCSPPAGTSPSACSKPRRRPPTSRPSSSNRTRIRARCRREAKETTPRRP